MENCAVMELLSQKISFGKLTIEIRVHDLSYRMGFRADEEPRDHLFVNLVAKDSDGRKIWTTPILSENGKVKPYSTVADALLDAKRKISESSELYSRDNPDR
jgi:hypothetical protein